MSDNPSSRENYHDIAEKVRTGEYFNEARDMYDHLVHDPMAERYLYIALTALALVTFFIAFGAVGGLYPLRTAVPFVVGTDDIVDNYIHIAPLPGGKRVAPGTQVLNFLVQNYVMLRERYNIDTFDRDTNGVISQSAPDVAKTFEQAIDRANPEGPIAMYQRHSRRVIDIVSSYLLGDGSMEVIYIAQVVNSDGDVKKSRWEANITFSFSGIGIDQKNGKSKPLNFVVTKYSTKRLQDEK